MNAIGLDIVEVSPLMIMLKLLQLSQTIAYDWLCILAKKYGAKEIKLVGYKEIRC